MTDKPWLASYPPNVPHEISPKWESIVDLVEESFSKFADRPAFNNMGVGITYQELETKSKAFAAYLQSVMGLEKGDRVALMMPNILQYPIALFGVLRAGLVVVNVNPLYTARELEHQLNDSGAKAIVILANFAATLEKVFDKVPITHVVVTELGDLFPFPKRPLINFVVKRIKKMVPPWQLPDAVSFNRALAQGAGAGFKRPVTKAEDIAFLQYTGGTTGLSKGAVLTHANISANVTQALVWIGGGLEEGKEVVITPLPLYHIFSLTANCFVFSALGGVNVLITNPRDIPGFVKELKKWPFTVFTGVNTLFNGLLNHPEFSKVDFTAFKFALGGGMAVQRAVAERWKEVTGVPLLEAYGLTETSPAACMNPIDLEAFNGFIGLPIPSTEVTIRNDDGEILPIGEVGELCIKGPQVTSGYWQKEEESKECFLPDGAFRTGDVATMTETGYVKIVDRKKDMILVSGFNVYPNEIEEVLVTHEKVLEVAAVGVPDEKSTEAVKIFVVKKDPSLSEADLHAFCRENLTGYKCPKHIEFRDELPKTNVGKILRRALRE